MNSISTESLSVTAARDMLDLMRRTAAIEKATGVTDSKTAAQAKKSLRRKLRKRVSDAAKTVYKPSRW